MRRLIYLDTDTLSSYIAQFNNGLNIERIIEAGYSQSESNAHINEQNDNQNKKQSASTEMSNEVQRKIAHDSAFNELMKHLEDSNLIIDDKQYIVSPLSRHENPKTS